MTPVLVFNMEALSFTFVCRAKGLRPHNGLLHKDTVAGSGSHAPASHAATCVAQLSTVQPASGTATATAEAADIICLSDSDHDAHQQSQAAHQLPPLVVPNEAVQTCINKPPRSGRVSKPPKPFVAEAHCNRWLFAKF